MRTGHNAWPPRWVTRYSGQGGGAYRCQKCQLKHNNIPWGIRERQSCSERGRCTLSQVQDSSCIPLTIRRSLAYMEKHQQQYRVSDLCRHSGVSVDEGKVLTKTVLPFVYTIFSLLALSLVYSPLAVVGLAEYKATFVKDIVFAGKVVIDITYCKGTFIISNYHKDAESPMSAIAIPFLNYHSISCGFSE